MIALPGYDPTRDSAHRYRCQCFRCGKEIWKNQHYPKTYCAECKSAHDVETAAKRQKALKVKKYREQQRAEEEAARQRSFAEQAEHDRLAAEEAMKRVRKARTVFEAIELCGHDEDWQPVDTTDFEPTSAPGGSDEKVRVLAERVRRGLPLHHPLDRGDYDEIKEADRPSNRAPHREADFAGNRNQGNAPAEMA